MSANAPMEKPRRRPESLAVPFGMPPAGCETRLSAIIVSPSLVIDEFRIPQADALAVGESRRLDPAIVDEYAAQAEVLEADMSPASAEQRVLRCDIGIGQGDMGLERITADDRRGTAGRQELVEDELGALELAGRHLEPRL